MEKPFTILQYCRDHNMTIEDFSNITGMSASHLYKIQTDRDYNISWKNIKRIEKATLDKFGEKLTPYEFLNY